MTGMQQQQQQLTNPTINSLPVVVLVVTAHQVCGGSLGTIGIMAAVIAGSFLSALPPLTGRIISGIIGGLLVPRLVRWSLSLFLSHGCPATATTIATTATTGIVVGVISSSLAWWIVCPVFSMAKNAFDILITNHGVIVGGILGCVSVKASMIGYYHMLMLPVIILQMEESGSMSFFGMLDMLALVMVSAGICLASVIKPRAAGEELSALRGLRINLGWGDYVEACYPYMERDWVVMLAGYVGALLGGAVAGATHAKSTAYVPWWGAVVFGEPRLACAMAMAAAFVPSFAIALCANFLRGRIASPGTTKS
mmetsp:Transcript_3710/g.6865  ORF Transcript_3710/g.6865 Transcript_3710/m.6865 type:complete len:310 (-) Transcript_3710:551-1480(-)